MGLQSKLFGGDQKLEAAAVSNPAHIVPGAVGDHVGKIQAALIRLDSAGIDDSEVAAGRYGPSTANAVLAYKKKRNIVNRSYQTEPDNIVGKMTIASLDAEMLAVESSEASSPEDGSAMQAGWRWCRKCQVLAFAGNQAGVCVKGGLHDHSKSGDYALAFSGIAVGQNDWRWCRKCQVLFYGGHGGGKCVGGVKHDASQSGDYVLARHGGGATGQSGWRWCSKCDVLAFTGQGAGECPAGGEHDHAQSDDYVLTVVGSAKEATPDPGVVAGDFVVVVDAGTTSAQNESLRRVIGDHGGVVELGLGQSAAVVSGGQAVLDAVKQLANTAGSGVAATIVAGDEGPVTGLDPDSGRLVSAWLATFLPPFVTEMTPPDASSIVLGNCCTGDPTGIRPMIGHILAYLVFVDGPRGSTAEFTPAEKASALASLFVGAGLLRRLSDTWGAQQQPPNRDVCGFTVWDKTVRLNRDPATLKNAPKTLTGRDHVWMQEALTALGIPPLPQIHDRIEHLRKSLWKLTFLWMGVDDAVPIFVTKYPCHWYAHANEWDAAVMWWPEIMGRYSGVQEFVFAHEIGHVFGAPDEYAKEPDQLGGCDNTSSVHGPFRTKNKNCALIGPGVPNPSSRPCVMRGDDVLEACSNTHLHWGWLDADSDGIPDLQAPGTLEPLVERVGQAGDNISIRGRNIWDARAVLFGDVVSELITIIKVDEINVVVPGGVEGVVSVSYLSRRGQVTGSFDDSWFLVAPRNLPVAVGSRPVVFGVAPNKGKAGMKVKIIGANIALPTAVSFGSAPAKVPDRSFVPLDELDEFDVEVPAGASGQVSVSVTTKHGISPPFPLATFTYE